MKFHILLITTLLITPLWADDDHEGHDHKEAHTKEESHKEEGHDDHDHEDSDHKADSHADHHDHKDGEHKDDDHAEEEGSSVVGPTKGILEKGKEGIKLSPEAIQTFELKTQTLTSKTLQIQRATLVEIKNDKFIYRQRNGWIQKVPVKVLNKTKTHYTVELAEFVSGDILITNGVGFVRTAELVAEEGVAHGHSH